MTSPSSCISRCRTASTASPARPTAAPNPFQFQQSFALVPEAALMFPKAYVIAGFLQDDWRIQQQPDAQPRPALRRRDHQGHSRLAGGDRQEQPRSAHRLRVGSEGRSEVVGPRRRRTLHAAVCDLHDRQGRRRRPQRPGDASRWRRPIRCSRCSRTRCRRSRRARCCRRATSRRSRPISRTSTRGQASIGFQRQLGPRTSLAVDANINRGVKHGFLDMNQAQPIPKDVLNAALASNPNATIRTQAQADATRPIRPVPNGFRRMDLLTNEGRSWYQGVRIAVHASHRRRSSSRRPTRARSRRIG